MLSSAICGIAATGITLSNVSPWPACGSMPFLTASAAQSVIRLSSAVRSSPSDVGVAAGVELDDRGTEAQRGFDLALGRLDEQADADAGGAELVDVIGELVVLPGRIEPALGRALLAPLGDDARGVRPMPERDLEHLLGRRHLEVQRQVDLGHQPVDVARR